MGQIRTTNVPAAVATALRRQIVEGERAPGERLPGNRELAALFGVSMGSIREAIGMLTSEGLIESFAGRGTYVAQRVRAGQPAAARVDGGRLLDRAHVQELIEAREIMELQLVSLAARRASAEQVDRIRAALERMSTRTANPATYSEADVEFHMAIAEAAGNRVLLEAMVNIRNLLRGELQLSNEVGARRYGDLQFSVDSHRRVFDAIEAGDPERARAELAEIMGRNHRLVLGLYGGPETSDETVGERR